MSGTLDPADQFPEGVPSRLIDPVDASYDHQTSQNFGGGATFYTPGLGACGRTATDSDLVAAIAADRFDAATPGGNPNKNPYCGRNIRVTRGGKSVVVKIFDRCEGCSPSNADDIDLSPAAFNQLADPNEGRVPITVQYI